MPNNLTLETHMQDDRPVAYWFPSWRELRPRLLAAVVPTVMGAVERACGGTVPPTLETEEAVRAWADQAGIRLVDPDIEPAQFFPNEGFASRAWAKAEYEKFHAWLVENKWLTPEAPAETPPEAVAEPVAEKRKAGRPRKEPAAA